MCVLDVFLEIFIEKSLYLLQKRKIFVHDLHLKRHALDSFFHRKVFILVAKEQYLFMTYNWRSMFWIRVFIEKSLYLSQKRDLWSRHTFEDFCYEFLYSWKSLYTCRKRNIFWITSFNAKSPCLKVEFFTKWLSFLLYG